MYVDRSGTISTGENHSIPFLDELSRNFSIFRVETKAICRKQAYFPIPFVAPVMMTDFSISLNDAVDRGIDSSPLWSTDGVGWQRSPSQRQTHKSLFRFVSKATSILFRSNYLSSLKQGIKCLTIQVLSKYLLLFYVYAVVKLKLKEVARKRQV